MQSNLRVRITTPWNTKIKYFVHGGYSAAAHGVIDHYALGWARSSDWLCLSREAATLGIREGKPLSSEPFPKGAILSLQILDHLRLLAADPTD